MLKLFINDEDRSDYLAEGSLTINDQIQNKANTASFGLNAGVTVPTESQEVVAYDCVEIEDILPDAASLFGYWKMDEDSGSILYDASANDRRGTITGATFDSGVDEGGLEFDGTDHVDLSGTASTPTAAITVSIWVKHTAFVDSDRIIWNDYSYGGTGTWIIYSDLFGNWVWGIEASGAVQKLVTGAHGFDTTKWHHLCGTYDGATQRFYVDGVEVGTPLSHTTTLKAAGTYLRLSHDAYGSFSGRMDEAKIYGAALTAQQVKMLYERGDVLLSDTLRSGLSISDYGKYRAGEKLWLGVGEAEIEARIIQDVDQSSIEGNVIVRLTEPCTETHTTGDLAGKKIFGGTITDADQSNPKQLTDVEVDCDATDFTKIFDRKLVNDTWVDYDARQIINDALNTTINYTRELDDMEYADNAAVQAEWTKSGDGGNPTNETADFIQGAGCVSFPWTFAAGSATFSATPTSSNHSDLTGASTGAPVKGNLTFWYKRSSALGISKIDVRTGSDSSNYARVRFVPERNTDWNFISLPLVDAAITGTPDWTAADYLALIITEQTNGSILIDDIRITAEGSFTMYNFKETLPFDDARASFKKPTVFLNKLMSAQSWYWYVDYDRDIHAFDREENSAPFELTDAGDNFIDLRVSTDTTQLKNRQVVRGGTKDSDSQYSQVVQGDNAERAWILKNLFVNLEVWLDNNTSTDTMEATTTTTTVKATAHGLTNGDWIVNRTRNAARQITYVDANTFTVLEVASQASGDTFSKFATQQDVGVENLDDETAYDYMYNYEQKSIRSATATPTLTSSEYLLFIYNEVIPIRVQVSDPASIARMKAIVGGDGIFDGAPISDSSLTSAQAAHDRAQAEVDAYCNPIVNIKFKTDYEGLTSGQLLSVTDTNKGINSDYLIQRVRIKYVAGDFPTFAVECASSLFGIIEYFQKLSSSIEERDIDESEIIDQIIDATEEIVLSEVNTLEASETASESATITITPSDTATDRSMTTDPYVWQPDASDSRWNLAQWG